MADGTAVPKDVVAELHCGGFPRATSNVNPKGEWDIDLTSNSDGVADATRASARTENLPERNATGVVNLSGCFVRAELPGYESTEIALSTNSIFDNPDVGDILLTKLAGITGAVVSNTSLTAPKKAAKSYERAVKESREPEPKWDKMTGWLEEAVGEYPQYAAAWEMLGRVRMALRQDDAAREAFVKAIAADPEFIAPYPKLVQLTAASGDLGKTVELADKALRLNPHLPEVRFYLCASQLRAGENVGAITTATQMIERGDSERFPQAYQLLGAALANTGDYKGAAKNFRIFLEKFPDATAAERIEQQLKEWEALGVISAEAN
jgi:cytochrome c-type biogenesis protein CcmH/NrfG